MIDDARLALAAVLHRTGPVSISPEDVEEAEDLELLVGEAPFGDPPGSKILSVRQRTDPRRDAIRKVLDANAAAPKPYSPEGADRLAGEILSALETAGALSGFRP